MQTTITNEICSNQFDMMICLTRNFKYSPDANTVASVIVVTIAAIVALIVALVVDQRSHLTNDRRGHGARLGRGVQPVHPVVLVAETGIGIEALEEVVRRDLKVGVIVQRAV